MSIKKKTSSDLPSSIETNKQIRALARQKAKASYWKLVVASVLMFDYTIITISISLTIGRPTTGSWQYILLVSLLRLFLAPLTIGARAYYYSVYSGVVPRLNELFRFCREQKLLITSICLELLQVILVLINAPSDYMKLLPADISPLVKNIAELLSLALRIITIYFSLRFYLSSYIFASDNNKNTLQILRESLHRSKGKIMSILYFGLTLVGPFIIVLSIMFGLAMFYFISIRQFVFGDLGAIRLLGIMMLAVPFTMPYWGLAVSGFTRRLLLNEDTASNKGDE